MQNKLYENYHKNIKIQKRVINDDDFTYKNTFSKIKKYVPKKGWVLDIGSATGTVAFYFANKGLNVDGIELSKNAYKSSILNRNVLNIDTVNFYNTPFEKIKFDKKYKLVTCFEVLEHLKDDSRMLSKIRKCMDKKSIFVITVPSANAPLYKIGLLDKFDKKVGHLRRYFLSDLCLKLNNSGFEVIKSYKSEGLFRSLLYTNSFFGLIIRFTKIHIINKIISIIDNYLLNIFSESQYILICKIK